MTHHAYPTPRLIFGWRCSCEVGVDRLSRLFGSRITLLLIAIGAVAGCQSIGDPGDLSSESLLRAARSSSDAVTLDIYWARTRLDDREFADSLWQSVQEDRIPVEVRLALANEGLRAGVVGGTPSEEIVRLLNPDGADAQLAADDAPAPLSATPAKVTRRLRQLRPGSRLEIQASELPRTMALFRCTPDGLVGDTYADAQGIYAVQLVGQQDRQAVLEFLPELHHGEPRMKITPGPGMVVQQLGRDVETYEALRTKVSLAPGEMLVVTSLPDAQHQLGGLFHHSSSDSSAEQKYLLVRLSRAPETPLLTAADDTAWPWN